MRLSVAVAVVTSVSALAQQATQPGNSVTSVPGVLPGMPLPISFDGDISVLAKRLSLSEAQMAALHGALPEYWEQWRAVQVAEFATFAPRQHAVASIWWNGPDHSTLQAFEVQSTRIEQSLTLLDQALFERIASILTGDQTPKLDLLRARRESEYLTADPLVQAWFPGGTPIELPELVVQCVPTVADDIIAAADSHERQQQRLLGRLNSAAADARSCWIDATRDVKKSPVDPAAPLQELAQHRNVIHPWVECLQPMSRIAADSLRTTRDAVQRIARLLPPDDARVLESTYFSRQFGQPFIMWFQLECELDAVARAAELDEAIRGKAAAAREQWFKEARPLAWKVVDGLIAKRVRTPNGLRLGMGPPAPEEAQLNASAIAADALRVEFDRMLYATLPREISRNILKRVREEQIEPLRRADPATFDQRDVDAARGSHLVGSPIPSPLTGADVDRHATIANETPATTAIDAAIDQYAAEFARETASMRSATSMPRGPAPRESLDPTRQRLAAYIEHTKRLQTLDEQLCVEIERSEDAARTSELLRLHRASVLASNEQQAWLPDAMALPVQFARILEAMDNAGDRAAACVIILERAGEITTGLDDYRAAMLALHEASEFATASRALRPTAEQAQQPGAWDALRQQVQRSEEAYSKAASEMATATRRLVGLQQQVAGSLVAAVGPDSGRAIDQAFAAQAFPEVFAELASARAQMSRAIALPQLDAEQRHELITWMVEHAARCDLRLRESIAALWTLALSPPLEQMAKAIAALQVEQMRIDQKQLASAVDATLRRILTPEQRMAVGLRESVDAQ